jgi:hypothetical protein
MPPLYWPWVASEAALIGSDACSAVLGIKVECCYEHDLSYRTGRDPRNAYLCFRSGVLYPWRAARPITRAEADARFRQCLMNRSFLGRYSPMAWWRWAGVRVFGGSRWDPGPFRWGA